MADKMIAWREIDGVRYGVPREGPQRQAWRDLWKRDSPHGVRHNNWKSAFARETNPREDRK